MKLVSGKYSGLGEWILKLLVLALAVYIISDRLSSTDYQSISTYHWNTPYLLIPMFFVLWLLNLLLDARIWQNVHALINPIKLSSALKTNLVSYSLAFITPANSGELAGRYIMMESETDRSKTIFLTFWSHFPRLITKLLLGLLAFLWWVHSEHNSLSLLTISLLIPLVLTAYFKFRSIQNWLSGLGWKHYRLQNYIVSNRPLFVEKLKLLMLSGLKFATYNSQFILILLLWSNTALSLEIVATVIGVYVIGAFIPTVPLADFLVKAGIAISLFNADIVDESLLINAALVTWFFNLAIPALTGGLIIFRFDLLRGLKKTA